MTDRPDQDSARLNARRTLMRRLFGSRITEVVGVAARLDLADAIGDGPARVADLASRYDLPPEALARLLRALTSLGLCTEPAPGTFALTGVGALLRSDDPESLRDFAQFHTSPQAMRPWAHLEENMRSGRPAFDELYGGPFYDYLAKNEDMTALFNAAMSEESQAAAVAVAQTYDFSTCSTVIDVGGGDGTLVAEVLRRHPHVTGTVFESAEGAAQATATLETAGLDGRAAVATGDFFTSVPAGADRYMIKSVLHNWDDARAVEILRTCRRGMPGHGRLLIIDTVLPETAAPDAAGVNPYIKDLQMMVLVGGRERTRAGFSALCEAAGLVITAVTPLPAHIGLDIVEARPA